VRVLVTGKDGQVGWELARVMPALGEVVAFGRAELDLADPASIVARVRDSKPDVIVNAAAYTAVDKAEIESEQTFLANADGPRLLAEEPRRSMRCWCICSTDYVFDGVKKGPYTENDATNPLSVYGKSKLAGETQIRATGCRHLILRTSWVSADRGKTFLLTILRLAKERPELRIVDDQHGAPTWARDIAEATAQILRQPNQPSGIYHLSAAGETTWCDFAGEITRPSKLSTPIRDIATSEYPTPAKRPMNSVLSNEKLHRVFGVAYPSWDTSLRVCLRELDLSVRGSRCVSG
jgi:dTDP-4-dehydrorhamnose reductase